ncbi:15-hydroxyprostaglandin dehydrogenase [NAD(+)]-like [Adelges cooleyi]|uniref:15-hydroxyprostaglandin dehydrogenase [NAD(+)]-like n=1 Tax=Adelges cooleyi TaxID=133065 RepID=UPI00217FA12E|nr:15-hydroxyprostaglandin dehydrogenase [NAD(+)]-like [Adelges cooleyi]
MSVKNQVALVTGGASGIGYEYVKYLLQNGAKVAVCDINVQSCEDVTEDLTFEYGYKNVIVIKCDVTDDVQFENAFKTCIKKYGKLNIVINNAGVLDNSLDNWAKTINVNYAGVVRGTMLAIKYMGLQSGGYGGTVVQTASDMAFSNDQEFIYPVYSSTKKAVVSFTKILGHKRNYDLHGIRMMSICPGFTKTPLACEVQEKQFWHKEVAKTFVEWHKNLPIQEPDHVGKALIEILKCGKTGESWLVEKKQPPKLIDD